MCVGRKQRAIAVGMGAVVLYALMAHVASRAVNGGFENPDPSWFEGLAPLWIVLALAIPGLFAGRLIGGDAVFIAPIAYVAGGCAAYFLNYGTSQMIRDVFPGQSVPLLLIRGNLPQGIAGLIAATVGWYLKGRSTESASNQARRTPVLSLVVLAVAVLAALAFSDVFGLMRGFPSVVAIDKSYEEELIRQYLFSAATAAVCAVIVAQLIEARPQAASLTFLACGVAYSFLRQLSDLNVDALIENTLEFLLPYVMVGTCVFALWIGMRMCIARVRSMKTAADP